MNFARTSILAGMISYSLLATACGSSQFGSSGKTSDAKPQAATSSADAKAPAAATDGAQASANPASTGTDSAAFSSSQFSAVSSKDSETLGCSLPAAVSKLMLGAVSANLTGWGGSGGSTELQNLNLSSCEWFGKAKAAGIARYMVVFNDTAKKQSYAQPYTGGVNAVAFAACIAQAAGASSAAGGTVTCSFMPL